MIPISLVLVRDRFALMTRLARIVVTNYDGIAAHPEDKRK
jgi:hypothetical protein